MRIDYKAVEPGRRLPRRYHWITLLSVIMSGILLVAVSGSGKTGQSTERMALDLVIPETVLRPGIDDPVDAATAATETASVIVRNGDSLALIFNRMGLSAAELHRLVNGDAGTARLTRLHPGDVLNFELDGAGGVRTLEYALDESRTLRVTREGDAFRSSVLDHPIERRIKYASGTIDSSLFIAARDAGLSDNLTMRLAAIFGWDIDFVLDIRAGDRFSLLYEEIYRDGEKLRDGEILVAEFVNRGRGHQAIRFVDDEGGADYYAPDGLAMRKAFLRAPLEFTRVSSRFNPNRRHPVLNTIRAHRGVDYAAPTGTPIRAAGDGRVVRRGPHGGYGNTVEIQHGGNITTLYSHLSRFQSGVTVGSRVRQGQVIGYVGMTGLATGPHLHYEFRLNGVHRNPLTVQLPDANPLPAPYMGRFQAYAQPLLAHLQVLGQQGMQVAVSRSGGPDGG